MIQKLFLISAFICVFSLDSNSQEALKYQLPPQDIIRIVDAPITPVVSVSPDKSNIVIIERPSIITISELSAEELRIGGLRINPLNSGPSRQTYNKGYKVMNIDGTNEREIAGLPEDPQLGSPEWSPDGKRIAYSVSGVSGGLYVINTDGTNQDRLGSGDWPAWAP